MQRYAVAIMILAASAGFVVSGSAQVGSVTSKVKAFETGQLWKGFCTQEDLTEPYPMVLTVTSRDGVKIEGTISWPTLDDSQTYFKGLIKDEKMHFEETSVLKGHVVAPVRYELTSMNELAIGTWIGTVKGIFHLRKEP